MSINSAARVALAASSPDVARLRVERHLRRFHPRYRDRVMALAAENQRLADLAVSFPGLLHRLACPPAGVDVGRSIELVICGAHLRGAAAAVQLPMWLRKIRPELFVCPLPPMPDGDLFRVRISNHLPRSPNTSALWFAAVSTIGSLSYPEAGVWIAREVLKNPKKIKPDRLRAIALYIWFSKQPQTLAGKYIDVPWCPSASFETNLARTDDWLTTLRLLIFVGRKPLAEDWGPPAECMGYEFICLDTIDAVIEEARAMKHCVRAYGHQLSGNKTRIFSVRQFGERVATLALDWHRLSDGVSLGQLRGKANATPPIGACRAAQVWLSHFDWTTQTSKKVNYKDLQLDAATWVELWRPYWMAKPGTMTMLSLKPSRDTLYKILG